MADPAAISPTCVIHQIFPKPLHDLVAKIRQETARADVLGDTGQPIMVIGLAFDFQGQGGVFAARLGLRFIVEGQTRALWTASELFAAIRGTPAEAVQAQILRNATDAAPPLSEWAPPAQIGLTGLPRLCVALMGSLTILTALDMADGFGPDLPATAPNAVCLPEGRSEVETLELGLRAASDYRRYCALAKGGAWGGAELDFTRLSPIRAA